MLALNDGRSELWQWDTARKLTVDAECSQVHFSNKVFGRSIDMPVIGGVVEIPDFLLQTDKDLTAWAFVGTAENGYTKISKTFKVNRRNKPADYVFTPLEQTTLGEIMERLDLIEESQDPDAIKNAVDDYLASNPIQVKETDPTVPDWAKQTTKPKYTATEVGALPDNTEIPVVPAKVSAFENDKGYLTEHQDLSGYAKIADLPKALPNPYALTFTGAVSATYNGSEAVSVEIPQGGGGEWRLINTVQITSENPVDFVEVSQDAEGNPFELSEVSIRVKSLTNYGGYTYAAVIINDKPIGEVRLGSNSTPAMIRILDFGGLWKPLWSIGGYASFGVSGFGLLHPSYIQSVADISKIKKIRIAFTTCDLEIWGRG